MNTVQRFWPVLLTLVFLGCSKEKRIENRLVKVGQWNITELTWTRVVEEVNDPEGNLGLEIGVTTGSRAEAGNFTFLEDGKGSYEYEMDNGVIRSGSINWFLENETIDIVDIGVGLGNLSISNGTGDFDFSFNYEEEDFYDNINFKQEAFAYSMKRVSRSEFNLLGGGIIQLFEQGNASAKVGQYAYTLEMTLKK